MRIKPAILALCLAAAAIPAAGHLGDGRTFEAELLRARLDRPGTDGKSHEARLVAVGDVVLVDPASDAAHGRAPDIRRAEGGPRVRKAAAE